jgi:hypothetical protein
MMLLPDIFVTAHVDFLELTVLGCHKVLAHLDSHVFGQHRE